MNDNPLEISRDRRQILVVDDDETSRLLARMNLEEAGYTVTEACDGRQALQIFDSMQPDAVLMDVMMPHVNGYEACAEMRERENAWALPIILMTSLDDAESIQRAFAVGATSFVIKPVNWDVEVQRIRYALRAAQAMRDVRDSEIRLRQSQKMEAVGRLAGGVAHDFNNLLAAIISYAQLSLGDLDPTSDVHEFVSEIKAAGERAATLTRQLLSFSRKDVLQPTVVNPSRVVEDMRGLLERLIGHDMHLAVGVDPGLGMVYMDEGQLEQIVMNLVVNAADASPDGGEIRIKLENVELDVAGLRANEPSKLQRFVMLAVRDTGVGMDEDTKSKIFEPFFTTKQEGHGTGLGLSTVFGIVGRIGGHINVYSEPGKGSTFKVYLPLDTRTTEDEDVRPASSVSLTGSETILLVEDEQAVRRAVSLTLQKQGYQVVETEDAEEALQKFQELEDQTDLLITDLVMPGMNGKELAEHLIRLRPDLRMLFISGHTENQILHDFMLGRNTRFLQKPFAMHSLLVTVRALLDT